MKRFVAALMLVMLGVGSANASVTIRIVESGTDVVATASGSVNTTSLPPPDSINPPNVLGIIKPSIAIVSFNGQLGSQLPVDGYSQVLSGPTSFGPGTDINHSSSWSGDVLSVVGGADINRLNLPLGYVSGSPLSSTATYAGMSLAGMGLTVGTYTYTLGSGANADSITVIIGTPAPAPVPTLSEWSQMLLGLLVMTMIGWHFHKQRSY